MISHFIRVFWCWAVLIGSLTISGCYGVDPLLAQPPELTRPDAVLDTPYELRAELDAASTDESLVKVLFANPLWSDALGQDVPEFQSRLQQQQSMLAQDAEAIHAQLGKIFIEAANVSQSRHQIELRLEAMDEIRQRTGFIAYVRNRSDLYNQRAEARRLQQKHDSAATRYGIEADSLSGTANSYQIERIDYVNSDGRVVQSQYTAAHDAKQRARMLLPFANAAANEQAELAAQEAEKAQRLSMVIAATNDADMEQVERHLFATSDAIILDLWPGLEANRKRLGQALEAFSGLTGQSDASNQPQH